ncbi:hypothetical protein DPMN_069821 [Dreissena polymorpha]|uniref:Uncharacterized protein n=1 Tax=Dreissena polymorpha TaxID=45954 RepID=A0A9D4BV85_DREPO|nr:hypothetical protein DPMN_069821 [Dreissena polymorpha]
MGLQRITLGSARLHQRYPPAFEAGTEVAFLAELDEVAIFPLWHYFFFSYLAEERIECSTLVLT